MNDNRSPEEKLKEALVFLAIAVFVIVAVCYLFDL